ncbi:hypothetical protein SYNPS1DRAFT_28628 [Syncephalis pseudoplumigaleata]|uniref:Dbl homology domain-containing protein n=1 Tax=Syncephalis pseudoplumigaleata TaxID=1712513 RepID=A0A4P9YZN2_9FUNG|nr:hypothetical protein SYNPS1DRAFT_28628 [Syncephalis pseudoplumigaleata]|eukprot:RKP25643.1 hypothetical protein SYNPS1DRAFT_28628 [Syncephalis pseudoplumigaleata]
MKSGSKKGRKDVALKVQADNLVERKPSNSNHLRNFFRSGSKLRRDNEANKAKAPPAADQQENYWPSCTGDDLSVFNHRNNESLIGALIDRKLNKRDGEDVKAIFVLDTVSNMQQQQQRGLQGDGESPTSDPANGDGEDDDDDGNQADHRMIHETKAAAEASTQKTERNERHSPHGTTKNKAACDKELERRVSVASTKSEHGAVAKGPRSSAASLAQLRKGYLVRKSISKYSEKQRMASGGSSLKTPFSSEHPIAAQKDDIDGLYACTRERASTYTYGDVASVLRGYHIEWRGEEEEELERLEENRRKAASNLVQCVRKHLQSLTLLRDVFVEPLFKKVAPVIAPTAAHGEKQIDTIFRCAMKLIPFHKFLLRDAEQALKEHEQMGTLRGIVEAVQTHMPGFQYYQHYLHEYPRIISTLEHLTFEHSSFRRALEKCSEDAGQINIRALLSAPKEHIITYHALLQKLVELYEPNDPEYDEFRMCLQKMQSIHNDVKQLLCIGEQKDAVVQIQASLDGLGEFLVSESRRLVFQGSLSRIIMPAGNTKQRVCFLFNDMLVFAKDKKNGRRNYKGRIYLHGIKIRRICHRKYPNTFVIVDSARKEFYFQAENDSFCREWVHHLREVMRHSPSMEGAGMSDPSDVFIARHGHGAPKLPSHATAQLPPYYVTRSMSRGPLRVRNGYASIYSETGDSKSHYPHPHHPHHPYHHQPHYYYYRGEYHTEPERYKDADAGGNNGRSPVPDAVPVAIHHF